MAYIVIVTLNKTRPDAKFAFELPVGHELRDLYDSCAKARSAAPGFLDSNLMTSEGACLINMTWASRSAQATFRQQNAAKMKVYEDLMAQFNAEQGNLVRVTSQET